MKKKNLATAMAAAMMFGGVAPVVAHADEKTNVEKDAKAVAQAQVTPEKAENLAAKPTVVNVSLVNAQNNPVVMSYSQVYNTEGTLTTSDDKLALNENQEILYADGKIGDTLKDTTAEYIVATKMSEEQIKQNKDKIEAAKLEYANAQANMEALKNLTFINKDGKTVPVYKVTDVTSPKQGEKLSPTANTKRTITFTNQEEGNGFAKEIVFEFDGVKLENHVQKVEAQMPTLSDVLNGKGFGSKVDKDKNKITLNVGVESGITGYRGLNRLGYILSQEYNSNNVYTKEKYEYNGGEIINKNITIYAKDTNKELGTIVLEKYNEFKKDNFKGFVNIPEMKDLNSLNQPELSWAKDDVLNALFNAQINGYEDHTLKLNNSVTRAEFAKMLVEIKGIAIDKEAKENFSDVNSSDWFKPYVATLAKEGIVKGDGDGTFRPNDTITRQEAAVMIAKVARMEKSVGNRDVDRFNKITGQAYDTKTNFKDDADIAIWADGSVFEMSKNFTPKGNEEVRVIKGYEDNTFRPENKITRAESIVMITRSNNKAITADSVTPEPIYGATIN